MYPKNFPVSNEDEVIINNAFIASKKLFSSPLKEKEKVKIIKNSHRGWESVSGESETFWFGQENGRYSNIWPSSFEYSSRKDLLRLFHLLFKKGGSELKNIDTLRKKKLNWRIQELKFLNILSKM